MRATGYERTQEGNEAVIRALAIRQRLRDEDMMRIGIELPVTLADHLPLQPDEFVWCPRQ